MLQSKRIPPKSTFRKANNRPMVDGLGSGNNLFALIWT